MQISLKWIQKYIDITDYISKPDVLADLLTNAGIEVESIQDDSKKYNNIVVGYILGKTAHTDADKLSVCQVEIKSGVVQQIVCGAKNHKEGDKVIVALPGAVLPGNFAIKQSVIRGVESNGMLCSEKELGISEESSGILILDSNAPVGTPFAKFQGLDDIFFELKVTPNRADCLSHYGLARELSCLLSRPINKPEAELSLVSKSTQQKIDLKVEEEILCPRYLGRYIEGVKIGPSPKWLSQAVESIGMNSINNVVDVTNFVMMEMGQPLHAFDADRLGGMLRVQLAKQGEEFTSLDGSVYKLSGTELMIRNATSAVALAGVVGGKNSGVTEETNNLFVECANFSQESVRKTSRKLGIETDSAYRFSRGVDLNNMEFVLDRCCYLLQQVAGGEIFSEHYDVSLKGRVISKFELSLSYLSQRLGYSVSSDSLADLLKRLSCGFTEVSEGLFEIESPSYRFDIVRPEDIVEEYARIFSYEQIPTTMPALVAEPSAHSKEYVLHRSLRSHLTGTGWQEALNYNFVNPKFQADFLGDKSKLQSFGIGTRDKAIEVLNPLNEDFAVMRTSLVPSMVKNIQYNSRHGREFGQLFEIGYAFGRDSEYGQDERLSFGIWGQEEGLWTSSKKVPNVLKLKAEIEKMLIALKAKSWKWNQDFDQTPDFLHPGQSSSLFFEGRVIGFIGSLHPKWSEKLKIKQEVAVAEFQLDALLRGQPKLNRVEAISKFPSIERDIAFQCGKEIASQEIIDLIKKMAGKKLVAVNLFDLYEGEKLGEGQKSMAFRLLFQDTQGTLNDEEINKIQLNLIDQISSKLNIQVR